MPALAAAYAECRAIARREAKNFYYAFVALPAARRNAICAIYAFMRQADDLADDESLSRAGAPHPAGCLAGGLARRLPRRRFVQPGFPGGARCDRAVCDPAEPAG